MSQQLSGYSQSPLELAAALMPVVIEQGRMHQLMEAVRIFSLKPGEGVALRGGEGREFLRVLRGRAVVQTPAGDSRTLDATDPKDFEFVMPAAGTSVTVEAETPVLVCHVDQEKFDFLVLWESVSRGIAHDPEVQRRMMKMHSVKVFRRLPATAVEEAVRRMERVEVEAGQEIVRQGDEGDAFYVIDTGHAEVWREEFPGDDPERVVTLGEGDAFGEDALVTGGKRNATVKMSADGCLLKLNKADFNELVSTPLIREVTPQVAKAMLDDGYRLLDVRYEEEFDEVYIPESELIPLADLRQRTDELDDSAKYVVYCRSGRRSAVAALLLSQLGIEAVSMRGGIQQWPFETETNIPVPPRKAG